MRDTTVVVTVDGMDPFDVLKPYTTGAVAQMYRERGVPEEALTPERVARWTAEINARIAEIRAAAERASKAFTWLAGDDDGPPPWPAPNDERPPA